MLALTRKKGESIFIGDNIEIVLLGVHGEQVKIGVVAPKSVPVYRKELYVQTQEENVAAVINADSIKNLRDAVKNLNKQ